MIRVYTDGSTGGGNPGPGGWGGVLVTDGVVVLLHGLGPYKTTSNKMELRAIYEALRTLPDESVAQVFSDSKYALGVVFNTNWSPKKNLRLIGLAQREVARLRMKPARHVKGHSGIYWNELADRLAGSGYHAIPNLRRLRGRELHAVTYSAGYGGELTPRGERHHILPVGSVARLPLR